MKLIIHLTIITILFIIYVEYSVGGIVFRMDSSGFYKFQLHNIIYYLFNPLYNKFLWNWQLLDVNYIFVLVVSLTGYILQNKI